jgi:hypothetical protein
VAALGTDSGNVIAVAGPGPDAQDPSLVTIGIRDGKEHVVGVLHTPGHSLNSIGNLGLSWSGSTLYAVADNDAETGRTLYAFDGRP